MVVKIEELHFELPCSETNFTCLVLCMKYWVIMEQVICDYLLEEVTVNGRKLNVRFELKQWF